MYNLSEEHLKYVACDRAQAMYPKRDSNTQEEQKNMKKTVALLLAAVMILGAFACSGGTAPATTQPATSTTTETTQAAQPAKTESEPAPAATTDNTPITSSEVAANVVEDVEVDVSAYKEAPMLAALVEKGELPKIDERIPNQENVFVDTNASSGEALTIGTYSAKITVPTTGVGNWGISRYGDQTLSLYNTDNTRVMNTIKSYDVNADYTQYTWHLREGMRWSDGSLFTADDITFWYYMCHINNYDGCANWAGLYTLADDGETKEYAKLEKVDDYTVVWTFNKPQYEDDFFTGDFKWAYCNKAFFEGNGLIPSTYYKENPYYVDPGLTDEQVLANALKIGIDMSTVKDLGKELLYRYWNYYQIPQFGAWILTDQTGFNTKNDDLIILRRNPYFFKVDAAGQQLPYIDEIYIQKYANNDQAQLAFLSGEIDDYSPSAPTEISTILAQLGDSVQLIEMADTKWGNVQYSFNYTIADPNYHALFNNEAFRQAMSIAINREEASQLLTDGFSDPCNAAPQAPNFGYNDEWSKHWTEFDAAAAKKLLEENCGLVMGSDNYYDFADGTDLIIEFITNTADDKDTVFAVIKKYWDAIGIKTVLKQYENDQTGALVDANDFYGIFYRGADEQGGIGLISRPKVYLPNYNSANWTTCWATYYDDPATYAGTSFQPVDERIDKIVELGKAWTSTPDKAERDKIELEIYKLTIEGGWGCAVYETSPVYHLAKSTIRNWFNNINEDKYYYIGLSHPWTWFLAE